uniref:protein JOKA2-like n=1 Tax=Erigeron canadensis TaxID=72917 RepID=UPI001CB91AD1|nr:protein JOKA2-like [Erigeron canadensis]
MASSSIVIKVKYGETLRRFNASINNDKKLALDAAMLREKIRGLFNFGSDVEFTMTYVDEDGDAVTLADDDDLHDVVRQSLNPLRITVSLNNGNVNGSAGTATPVKSPQNHIPFQALNSGVAELLKAVPEPFRETLVKFPLDLASKATSSSPTVSELMEKMKAVYLDQISASMAGQSVQPNNGGASNVNSQPATGTGSKVPVNPEAESSKLKKKEKQVEKAAEGVKFKEVQQASRDVDLNVPFNEYESLHAPINATKSISELWAPINATKSVAEASNDDNKNTTDGVERKKDKKVKYFTGGFWNEPLPKPASLGSSYVDHSNQMRQYHLDQMEAQAAKLAKVAADVKASVNNSGSSSSWAQGMLKATNECPFAGTPFDGTPLLNSFDSQGHHRHSRGHHWKRHSFENGGFGNIFHRGVRCDGCGVHPITGPRFKSKVKDDYDLCSICFQANGNAGDYIRIDRPTNAFRHHVPLKGLYDHSVRIPPPVLPHALRAPGSKLPRCKLDSRFILDVNVLDGTIMAPFTPFTKIWRMRNNGSIIWPHGSQLHWIGGDRLSNSQSVDVEIPADGLAVDKELDVAVDFTAPERPGRYVSYWRMASPSGQKFGQRVWVLIQVDSSMKDMGETEINLNLPPVTRNLQTVDQDNIISGNNFFKVADSETMSIDSQPKDQEMNFPINDSLIIDNCDVANTTITPLRPVAPAISTASDSTEIETGLASLPTAPAVSSGFYPTVGLDSASLKPVSYPTVDFSAMPPILGSGAPSPWAAVTQPSGSAVASSSAPVVGFAPSPGSVSEPGSASSPVSASALGSYEVTDEQELALMKDLEDMGFKQRDVNKEILRKMNYDLEKSIDALCDVSEWDPMLDELQEMGFEDNEANMRLLKKNNGSIKRVVMDLINGEKA